MRKRLVLVLLLPLVAGCAAAGAHDDNDSRSTTGVPDRYRALVRAAGNVCSPIGSPLLAAQIDQESGWDPKAKSAAGAQGIAQFMPATWKKWGIDADGDGTANVWNPADAIPSQAVYMCYLYGEVAKLLRSGNATGRPLPLTLAAYNAGLGTVRAARGMPSIIETQEYVASILSSLPQYRGGGKTGPVVVPLHGFPDSDNYGERGSLWSSGYHTGDDFPAPCGTPVHAATRGTITVQRDEPWAGIALVQVTAPTGTVTWYAHMQLIGVHTGDQVIVDEVIGQVGDRGNATGCHLHFEVHPNGGPDVDPHTWLIRHGANP